MSEINSLICNQLLYGILLLRFYWRVYWMVLAGMLKLWADIKCTFWGMCVWVCSLACKESGGSWVAIGAAGMCAQGQSRVQWRNKLIQMGCCCNGCWVWVVSRVILQETETVSGQRTKEVGADWRSPGQILQPMRSWHTTMHTI